MTPLNPFAGSELALYYVFEDERGVTPENPVLTYLKSTGGMPTLSMDAIESAELGNGREVNDIDLGNVNIAASITCELTHSAHDDLIAGIYQGSWVAGKTVSDVDVTVDPVANTYTRAAGDFVTDGFAVGDFVQFADMTNETNAVPRFITAVTPTVITVGGVKEHKPLVAETATTGVIKADSVGTGSDCKYMTVIAEMKGKCGTQTAYLITTGVEVAGGTITADLNAKVSAEFPMIGYDQKATTVLPAGATFNDLTPKTPYSNIDSSITLDGQSVSFITTFSFASDDSAAAMFTLGSDLSAFVERQAIKNTVSAAAYLGDLDLLVKYRNKEWLRMEMILVRKDIGSMAFVAPEVLITEATPERSAGSVTANLAGQARGSKTQSSVTCYRIK